MLTLKNSPILKIKDYRLLIGSRWLQTFSLQFLNVIIGWQVYQLRKEALLLGLLGLAEAMPAIGSSFFAGHFVDISRPAKIFRIGVFLNALNALVIFIGVGPWLETSTEFKIVVLFLGIFVTGLTRSFIAPAQFSMVPIIVSRELMPAASAFNSSSFTLAQILGPALGGVIYGFYGPTFAFAVPVVLIFASFITSLRFSKKITEYHPKHHRKTAMEPMLKSIQSGIRFLIGHKILFSTMCLDTFSVLFGGAVAVLPIFADQVYHIGPSGLGILRAAPAVGAVMVSLYMGLNPMKVISGGRLLFAIAGFGFSIIAFGLTTNFYLALFFLGLSGIFDGINMVTRGTITQLLTPDHMRGRVSSLGTVFITSSNEIGAFESGLAAQYMGLIPSVIFGGIMTLVIVAAVIYLVPELKQMRIRPEAS